MDCIDISLLAVRIEKFSQVRNARSVESAKVTLIFSDNIALLSGTQICVNFCEKGVITFQIFHCILVAKFDATILK